MKRTGDKWIDTKIEQCEEFERRCVEVLERAKYARKAGQKGDRGMTGIFVDISAFNPSQIDWQAYKAWSSGEDGIARVAIRSSYGKGYTDAHFTSYRAGALAAGIDIILFYHYSYPQYTLSPVAEANWQKSVVGDIRPQDRLILDFEENTPEASAAWALTFLQTQEANYNGHKPAIYASSAYIQQRLQDSRLAAYPLWLADWQFTLDARPPCPAPWSQYEFLQYTDRATSIPGIAGTVDADIFLGAPSMHLYGPTSADFTTWFTVDQNGNWVGKNYHNPVVMGGNRALYSQLSLDGNTLPIIGLPHTSEMYQHDSDGYSWSVQFFERGVIVYDPSHRQDSQPGMGASYLGKYPQFAHLDPG